MKEKIVMKRKLKVWDYVFIFLDILVIDTIDPHTPFHINFIIVFLCTLCECFYYDTYGRVEKDIRGNKDLKSDMIALIGIIIISAVFTYLITMIK